MGWYIARNIYTPNMYIPSDMYICTILYTDTLYICAYIMHIPIEHISRYIFIRKILLYIDTIPYRVYPIVYAHI